MRVCQFRHICILFSCVFHSCASHLYDNTRCFCFCQHFFENIFKKFSRSFGGFSKHFQSVLFILLLSILSSKKQRSISAPPFCFLCTFLKVHRNVSFYTNTLFAHLAGDLSSQLSIVEYQLNVGIQAVTTGDLLNLSQQERSALLALYASST